MWQLFNIQLFCELQLQYFYWKSNAAINPFCILHIIIATRRRGCEPPAGVRSSPQQGLAVADPAYYGAMVYSKELR